jgi:hypothetical protein
MILKTGPCFTSELELNCSTIVGCVTALPVGPAAVAGTTQVLGKDGQYHTLPAAPVAAVPALSVSGNQLTIAGGNTVTLPDNDTQDLSISGNVISLTNGGSVTLPTATAPDGSETKVTAGTNVTVTGAGTTASPYVVTAAAASGQDPYANTTETRDGTATDLIINPYDLYLREHMAAQSNLGLDIPNIPTPGPGDSMWGENTLGEVLHYAPGLGWQIVDHRYGQTVDTPAGVTTPAGVWGLGTPVTAPRAGRVLITSKAVGYNAANHFAMATGLFKNGSQITQSNMGSVGSTGTPPSNAGYQVILQTPSIVVDVVAGDVLAFGATSTGSSIEVGGFIQLTYL